MLDTLRFWRGATPKTMRQPDAPAFTIYALKTAGGTWLSAAFSDRRSAGRITLESKEDRSGIYLCVCAADQVSGFLVEENAEPIELPGLELLGTCLPLKIDRDHASGQIRLFHPLARSRRLGQDNGTVTLDLRPPDDATAFFCEPVNANQLSPRLIALARQVAGCVQAPARWRPILDALNAGALSPGLAEALLYRLPRDELEDLASELLNSARYRRAAAMCLGGSAWPARMADLTAWRSDRDGLRQPVLRIAEKDFSDIPGSRGNLSFRPQLGLHLSALMRRQTHPRRMASVLGSARNEGAYLLEWIAYHRAIGFDHVFIYTNDNSDGSDQLLDLLARSGIITWIKSEIGPNTLPQFRAYAHALGVLPEILDYRWTLIADLDEFFAYDTGYFACLRDYLAWQEIGQADAVALPWLIYLAGADDVWRDAPCVERFTLRQGTVNHHVKTMFRTNLFWSSTAHNPYASLGLPITYKADNATLHIAKSPENNQAFSHNPQATHAWISHHIFKSASDAVMKALRGKGDRIESERQAGLDLTMKHFVALAGSRNTVTDLRTRTCGASLRAELSALRDLRGVADCDAAIKQAYQKEMSGFCTRIIQEGFQPDEPKECAVFRSLLLKQRQKQLFSVA